MYGYLSVFGGLVWTPPPPLVGSTLREAVQSLLGQAFDGPINHFMLPQSPRVFPAITYSVVGRTYDRNLRGPNGVSTATVRVSCWSRDEIEAAAIAQQVRSAMDGFQGAIGTVDIMGCSLGDETDLPEFPRDGSNAATYQVVLTFTVTHRVSVPVNL